MRAPIRSTRRRFVGQAGRTLGWSALLPILAACQAAPPQATAEPKVVERVVTQVVERVVEKPVDRVVTQVVTPAAQKPSGGEIANLTIHFLSGVLTEPTGVEQAKVYTVHLAEMQDQNPNIRVRLSPIPGGPEYRQKIAVLAAAGQVGDVMQSPEGAPAPEYARLGIIQPVDKLAASSKFDLGAYLPDPIKLLRYDKAANAAGQGDLWALPSSVSPNLSMLIFNKTLFDKAGLAPPTENTTLEQLISAAEKLTKTDASSPVAGILYDPFYQYFGGYGWASCYTRDFGGEIVDTSGTKAVLNSPESKAAYRLLADLIKKRVQPRKDQLESVVGDYRTGFWNQRVAMFRNGPWSAGVLSLIPKKDDKPAFEAGIVPWVKGPSGKRGSWLSTWWFGVSSTTKWPEAAFQLAIWVTDKYSGIQNCKGAFQCGPRPDVVNDPEVQKNPILPIVNKVVAEASPPNFLKSWRDGEVGAILNTELEPLWQGNAEPTDAFFDAINKKIQAVLDKPPV